MSEECFYFHQQQDQVTIYQLCTMCSAETFVSGHQRPNLSTQKFWPTPPAVLSLADKPLRMQLTELPRMHSSLLTPGRPELTARLLWSCPPVTSQGAAQFHFTGCPRGPGASGCPVHKPPSLSPLSHGPFQAPWSPIFLPTPMHSHWEPLLQQQSRL